VTLDPVDLWLPIEQAEAHLTGSTDWRDSRQMWWVSAVARLGDGVAVEAADEQASRIHLSAGGDESMSERRAEQSARLEFAPLVAGADSEEARVVRWLAGVSGIVLLIACANVANLLLARGARRRREVAVRLAMGVSRRRLVAHMSAEAVLLAALGGVVAIALARWGGAALRSALLPDVLFPDPVGGRVLLFTAAASLLAGLLAGVGPALQTTRPDLAAAMTERSRGSTASRSRTRGLLVVVQAAMSLVLLVGAGLFVKSLNGVRSLDLGLDVDQLLLARLETTSPNLEPLEQTEIHRQAAAHLERLPGVSSVAYTNAPLGWGFAMRLSVPGIDSIPRMPGGGPYYWAVDPDYFRTVGLEVLEGRAFEPADAGAAAARVAIVSRMMADTLWGGGSALGQCMLVGPDAEACTTVVGVVEDASRGSLEVDPALAYYLPFGTVGRTANGLYVRTTGRPAELAGEVALALRSFSPEVRFARVQTVREYFDPQARSWSLGATMFTIFGALALVVAAIGLYSLLAFEVAEKRRELGIRMALGAARARVVRGVLGGAARLVLVGIALGLATAWVASPRVEDLLFGVAPRDPTVLGGVAMLLGVVALIATVVPARRATRIDPMEAMRVE
jgi:predicted permease